MMKRIGWGLLLIFIAVMALIVVAIMPAMTPLENIPSVGAFFQSVLCEKGETLRVERHTATGSKGGTSYSAQFFCINENLKRDVSDGSILIGLLAFVGPLLLGILSIISGATSVARRTAQISSAAMLQGFGVSTNGDPKGVRVVMSDVGIEGLGPLVERLKTLKATHAPGTLTEEDVKSVLQDFGAVSSNPNAFHTVMSGAGGTLADRLKVLKDAYEQGLITETEYEDKRQTILREV